ncbi:hypothetical protein AAFC00_006712 [Neodothiora populina]|uniref:THUMP domain-containing protein n=1 Tax=Neodothiora populina TaxID=2781224 RepID=A0ABR3PB61_9PEZI
MADTHDSRKRKAGAFGGDDSSKRSKQQPRGKQGKGSWNKNAEAFKNRSIQPGDSGIWATCDKGREGKCIAELRDLFGSYAEELYSDQLAAEAMDVDDDMEMDLEASIKAEVEGIKKPTQEPLFIPIKLDVQCVLFFRTRAPIEPVSFVRHICRDALNNPGRKRTRFAKRLSPMTLMGRASEEGLDEVAKKVLAPHFHKDPPEHRKFAIRPTLRNHNVLKRDVIIQKVAAMVGHGHKVDLKNYDDLIVVEAYTNVCGMSVVPSDFEELKRYNLAEIFSPTPKEQPKAEAIKAAPEETSNDAKEVAEEESETKPAEVAAPAEETAPAEPAKTESASTENVPAESTEVAAEVAEEKS